MTAASGRRRATWADAMGTQYQPHGTDGSSLQFSHSDFAKFCDANDSLSKAVAAEFAKVQVALVASQERSIQLLLRSASQSSAPSIPATSSSKEISVADESASALRCSALPTASLASAPQQQKRSIRWASAVSGLAGGRSSASRGKSTKLASVVPGEEAEAAEGGDRHSSRCKSAPLAFGDNSEFTSLFACDRDTARAHASCATSIDDSEGRGERASQASQAQPNMRYELAGVWGGAHKRYTHQKAYTCKTLKTIASTSTTTDGDANASTAKCRWLALINPNAPSRILWDFCSLVVVMYEMVTVPLLLFELEETSWSNCAAWVARLFWTADMPLSFLTGWVNSAGDVVMDLRLVCRRYLRTWFFLDASIVGTNWVEFCFLAIGANMTSGADYTQFGRASRTFRILRMLRLLRLIRMQETCALIAERFQSESMGIVVDVCRVLFVLLGLSHFIACLWYGLGSSRDGAWVASQGLEGEAFAKRYTLSLHWSLAQFAGGMDEVTAANAGERVFAICVFLLAFILASCFVSVITSSMTQGYLVSAQRSQQVAVLRRYLCQNNISKQLAMRVQRNALCTMTHQQLQTPEDGVELLRLISEPLRVELHFETNSPLLAVNPFFANLVDECPQVIRRVCHSALQMQAVAAGDVIFSAAEIPKAPKVYFVCGGVFEYHFLEPANVSRVLEGDWVAEAALWTSWFHRGDLAATSEAKLLLLDVRRFHEVAVQFEHLEYDPAVYGREFVRMLNACEEDRVSDLSGCMRLTGEKSRVDLPAALPRLRSGTLDQSPILARLPSFLTIGSFKPRRGVSRLKREQSE